MSDEPLLLVVDDDPDFRVLLNRFLRREGFRIIEAGGGAEALAVCAEARPELVLLDVEMPDLDGFAVCRQLREDRRFRTLPVIMVTGHDDDASVDRAYQAGADEYITKPFHRGALRNRVHYLIQAKRSEQELKQTRRYLQNIIDSMPSVLVSVDGVGHVTLWNRAAEHATGVAADSARGRPLEQIYPILGAQMEAVRQSIHERAPRKTERLKSQVAGEIHYTDVMIYPLLANGAEGAVIRVDDVTARVRIEDMMVRRKR